MDNDSMPLVNVSLLDGNPSDLYSLVGWLQRTDEFRGRVKTLPRQPGPHEMGGATEIVSIVLGSGASAVLAGTLTTWLQTRRAKVSVEFVVSETGETLRRVEVDGGSAASVKELYEALAPDRTVP
jgi:hypothetical protein